MSMEGRRLFMCSMSERSRSSKAATLEMAPAATILLLTGFLGRHVAARASIARFEATRATRKAFGCRLAA